MTTIDTGAAMMNCKRRGGCKSLLAIALAGAMVGLGSGARVAAAPTTSPKQPWPAKNDRAGILRELRDYTAAGFDRRFGPSYAAYHAKKDEKFPDIYLAPTKQDHNGRPYQLGGPWSPTNAGDFSSTQGQVLYVPAGNTFPVDRVTIAEWTNGTYSEKPEAPWHGGFRPEPASKKWIEQTHGQTGMPIGEARGYGSWANCGVIVFSSGLVSTAGTVTARGTEPTIMLPPHKLPTAISVTNKNEFALITVCDTETHKGQVAVISLGVNGKKTHFVHEWQDDHAWSLPNVAMLTDLKLLGFVDLPGIEFPTGVCAVGNHVGGRMNGRDGNAGILREYDLARQGDRDVFLKGNNAHYGSTTGFAVVTGKYEGKAAFIDLQSLFTGVREMYFTTEENYQKTRDAGPGPKQWPYTFEGEPRWKPTVVATVDVPQPTAVLASLEGGEKARAFIASLDGRVGVYSVGGLATDGPASPREVNRLGDVQVGRNPTWLTYQKGSHDTIIACSRGDRKISWIKYSPQGAQVTKELRDARLIDPVQLEVADTHGIETSLLTVADFRGGKIVNYRYGEARFATQGGARFGMGPDGKDEFECGGVMEFPGAPFCVSAANVN